MSKNLNENLYSRFGLKLELEKIQSGFQKYLKNLLLDKLQPLVSPGLYQDKDKFFETQRKILKESCRQMFLDYDDYDNFDYGFQWFLEKEFYDKFSGNFQEYVVKLQILLNIVFDHKLVSHELKQLAKQTGLYLDDYPILGIKLKIYKTKPPQILPSVSKFFDKEMENVLGLLEAKKYKNILEHFEEGLKEFLIAKTKFQLKDVIEDMHSACDEMVKCVLGDNNKSFKHVYDKNEYKKLGLNGYQKEMYKNLKSWMDSIKHGSTKDFARDDVEMIISFTSSLMRYVLNKGIREKK